MDSPHRLLDLSKYVRAFRVRLKIFVKICILIIQACRHGGSWWIKFEFPPLFESSSGKSNLLPSIALSSIRKIFNNLSPLMRPNQCGFLLVFFLLKPKLPKRVLTPSLLTVNYRHQYASTEIFSHLLKSMKAFEYPVREPANNSVKLHTAPNLIH